MGFALGSAALSVLLLRVLPVLSIGRLICRTTTNRPRWITRISSITRRPLESTYGKDMNTSMYGEDMNTPRVTTPASLITRIKLPRGPTENELPSSQVAPTPPVA
ncbi:hypothetical protein K435DRAFT_812221 [Dendrothele bispora CBS 962.96]|uniref:Secreted protein n=1 Tax=Dendrothele bispora (strain CBS 962.96) TaxID=1314807 RepID=A0A4S8KPU0_DENBC|nr:hypothetical protein K435DRAFT_812221 [Dendrothele bispora CBS 962.96]